MPSETLVVLVSPHNRGGIRLALPLHMVAMAFPDQTPENLHAEIIHALSAALGDNTDLLDATPEYQLPDGELAGYLYARLNVGVGQWFTRYRAQVHRALTQLESIADVIIVNDGLQAPSI